MSLQEVIWDDMGTDVITRSQSDRWEQGMRLFSFKNVYCRWQKKLLSACTSRSIPEGALVDYGDTSSPSSSMSASSPDTDLRLAMELSAQAQAEEDRMRKQEEEELERILQLSLTEK